MSCYISSNDNRLYAATEDSFGRVPVITAANQIPGAVRLTVRSSKEKIKRADKTGRTFQGNPSGRRTESSFRLRAYLTGGDGGPAAGVGALLTSALGNEPAYHPGGLVDQVRDTQLHFPSPHGLEVGQAVAVSGEIRFVAATTNENEVVLNAPFTEAPAGGAVLGPTVTYRLGARPGSTSIFDYWSPESTLQRVLSGAVVDEMKVLVNGDLHEFEFSGPAARLVDSYSFTDGEGGLQAFPDEPAESGSEGYSVIPGHLGQVWVGAIADRLYSLTSAEISLSNGVDMRAREFGFDYAQCYIAGKRNVAVKFSTFERADQASKALYQAARSELPISMMFQLGTQPSQLCGVYMKSLVPEVPQRDDTDARVEWKFGECRAQGIAEDELMIGFA